MSTIPRDGGFDSSLALLSDGYLFISKRCARHQSNMFETRLMLERAVCMLGEEAAEVFYENGRFTRKGAMPQPMLRLLQDIGSVQQLDGAAHRHRKAMFMSLMTPEGISGLAGEMERQWHSRAWQWARADEVVLLDELQAILCQAACVWAGVPLSEENAGPRTRELAAMIEAAGAFGPRGWRALLLRRRTERWAQEVVLAIRRGELQVPEESAAHAIAWHRDLDGELLDGGTAAVELINLLRPILAIAVFVMFAAHALHEHPEIRQRLQAGDGEYLEAFVQEVRRFYPFFPFVGGRVRAPFDWRGHHFAEGTWVLLDIYGTNHDPRSWDEPDVFRPERFHRWDGSAFDFVPQGGGDFETGHRCPGEWITIELMKRAVRLLTTCMHYDVPDQDLRIDLSRMPSIPKSRFVIADVKVIS